MTNVDTAVALKKELDALRPLTPEQESKIWQKFRFDWNYHSNNIEGNSLTFGETKSLLLHNITAQGKPLKDHIEITGHNEAIEALTSIASGGEPLTESFVRSLHVMILRERYQSRAVTPDGVPTTKWIEVGQYKTLPNHVRTVTGETFWFAEPIEVQDKMHALIQEINENPGASEAERIVAAAKVHYDFVLIHPFDDGNGRMARLMMNLVFIKYGFPPAIIKTHDKENYFAALRQADGGQFEVFVEYIAGCVCGSLRIMLAGARGEEIDEFDIRARQKVLALERLLAQNGTHVVATKSPETVSKAIDSTLSPLRAVALSALEKFSRLLASTTVEYFSRTTLGFEGLGHYDYTRLSSREETQNVIESGTLVLRVTLSGVRSVGLSANQKSWDFIVAFFDDHLQIRCDALSVRFDVRYESELSGDQLRTVDQALTNSSIKWLQEVTGIDVEKILSGS
jgi:Fic family protein